MPRPARASSPITGDREVEKGFIPALSQNLKSIGIVIKDRVLKDAYTPIQTPRLNIPFSTRAGWGKDYADALTFFGPLFDGRNIIPQGNTNYSLLGITPAIAKKVGVKGSVTDVPEHQRRSRQVRRARRRPARQLLRGARQEAHLSTSRRGCPTSGPTRRASRARTSPSSSSTSSAGRSPTRTWRSSPEFEELAAARVEAN